MASPKKPRVVHVQEDTWYALSDYDRDICCDCGLTHDTRWKFENGRIMFMTRVNKRETAKHRQLHGIKLTRRK